MWRTWSGAAASPSRHPALATASWRLPRAQTPGRYTLHVVWLQGTKEPHAIHRGAMTFTVTSATHGRGQRTRLKPYR